MRELNSITPPGTTTPEQRHFALDSLETSTGLVPFLSLTVIMGILRRDRGSGKSGADALTTIKLQGANLTLCSSGGWSVSTKS